MTASARPDPEDALPKPTTPAWRAWLQAARLPSQMYIFWPLLLGQALAMGDGFSWEVVLVCHLYGLASQLYIVFANDVADMATDRRNFTFTPFSGGSRVLVDGLLSRRQLARAAVLCAVLSALAGVFLGGRHGTWLPLPLILFGLALLWAYSYPPLRLSYRGGGEYLQMVGVGLVLPMIGFSAHAGTLAGLPWAIMPLMLALSLSCAMATALPDEPSDRADGKRTHAVRFGIAGSRRTILRLNALALVWFVFVPLPGVTLFARAALALPCLILCLVSLILAGARPGERGMLVFVTAQVAFSLTPMIGLAILFLAS
ncbi:1,4-dihydroxy-2-naphthoate octaprenyltransferase [Desulfomicrobium norvegicum]|uniref:1,4-dihydroxy-2-naphthoate octaprenyltransferase n=1 Tax=Desulfomicrobium norvegicum (strain DSM 1741 / NCIMB 8310) TaxID=52561 RepID=A0A8G2C1H7_DESNO|nr:prenyltransferase [Desulfomicrobium norvegicum]SFL51145.1 1,4-dihydroxy-2-naphthoate octaprenyltransferase [Desulfomicrobium norvegicum]